MIIPAGAAQINFVFGGSGAPTGAEWTIGFDGTVGLTPLDLANRALDAWDVHLQGLITSTTVLESVRVKFGPNDTGPSTELAANLAGGETAAAASPNVAYLVHKNTALGGRRGRGRAYMPGVAEGNIDPGGNMPGVTVDGFNTALAGFADAMEDGGGDLVVLHAAGNTTIPVPTPITSLTVDPRIATQRRRLRR